MKKFLILMLTLIFTIVLFATGCKPESSYGSDSSQDQPPGAEPPNIREDGTEPAVIEGLIRDEYDGLEFSVNVLERKAILPGTPFQATLLVENKGDKTVTYVHGSGSFEIPEALFLYSGILQTVLPKDRLGVMTADYQTATLEPGDSLLFRLNVMAIEPDPDFDAYTLELYSDDGIYIFDMEWAALQERFPGLVAAQPGNYVLKAYFLYRVYDENEPFDAFSGPTGFAEAETVIGIS